jgi:hypothetical protein
VASLFARHAEVLGSSPGGEFSFFADFFMGSALSLPLRSTIVVRQTGVWEIMHIKGGSPHLAG